MRTLNLGGWLIAGSVSFISACGDASTATMTDSQGGSSGSTAATGTATESGTDSTVGASNSATETGGSNSESATMNLPTTGDPSGDPTSGPTSDSTTGTTGAVSATDTTAADTTAGTTAADTTAGTTAADTTAADTTAGETGEPLGPCDNGNKWTLDADFDQGILNNINHDAPNGDQLQITLGGISAPQPYMFVAQTNDGWLLKIDTETGKQTGRYETTRIVDCPTCNGARSTWYPSRVVVDLEGDVYVANRAFGYQGSITKIAGSPSGCIDRNNNGKIDTSNDANNDGIIDVTSLVEFKGQDDECVLYTLAIGATDTYPRALTIDGKGNGYVGTYVDMKAYKLDLTQNPPKITKTIDLPSTPYGFVVRGDYLYSSALGQPVMRVDLLTDKTITMNAPGNYGITVDQNGIAWFGGSGLQRCDFEVGGSCVGNGFEGFSGVAVDADGQIWGATGSAISKYDNSGKFLGSVPVQSSYGVAIGHDGKPRGISAYAAQVIEPGAKGAAPVSAKDYYTGIVGNPSIYNYTYTDFTGFGALNVTIKKGEWTVIHDGGAVATQWSQLLYNTEKEGNIPAGTEISFQMRAADLKADLEATPWITVVDGAPEQSPTGQFVEIRARLLISQEDVDVSPVLSDVCVIKAI